MKNFTSLILERADSSDEFLLNVTPLIVRDALITFISNPFEMSTINVLVNGWEKSDLESNSFTLDAILEQIKEDYEPIYLKSNPEDYKNIDIQSKKETSLKIREEANEEKEESNEEKYDLEDILNSKFDELVNEIKEYTKKKYKTLGGVRFDYINFLQQNDLLTDNFISDLDNIYTNEKLFKQALQDDVTTDPSDFKEKYLKLVNSEIVTSTKPLSPVKRSTSPVKPKSTKKINMEKLYDEMKDAISQGDISEIQNILDKGYNINYNRDESLMDAVTLLKYDVVKFLIEKGAEVDSPISYGETIFVELFINTDKNIFQGDSKDLNNDNIINIANLLLENGADIKSDGGVALQYVTRYKNKELIQFFLFKNVEILPETILEITDDNSILQLLVDYGADIDEALKFAEDEDYGENIIKKLENFRDNVMVEPAPFPDVKVAK